MSARPIAKHESHEVWLREPDEPGEPYVARYLKNGVVIVESNPKPDAIEALGDLFLILAVATDED